MVVVIKLIRRDEVIKWHEQLFDETLHNVVELEGIYNLHFLNVSYIFRVDDILLGMIYHDTGMKKWTSESYYADDVIGSALHDMNYSTVGTMARHFDIVDRKGIVEVLKNVRRDERAN